jgi:hypothetical protein
MSGTGTHSTSEFLSSSPVSSNSSPSKIRIISPSPSCADFSEIPTDLSESSYLSDFSSLSPTSSSPVINYKYSPSSHEKIKNQNIIFTRYKSYLETKRSFSCDSSSIETLSKDLLFFKEKNISNKNKHRSLSPLTESKEKKNYFESNSNENNTSNSSSKEIISNNSEFVKLNNSEISSNENNCIVSCEMEKLEEKNSVSFSFFNPILETKTKNGDGDKNKKNNKNMKGINNKNENSFDKENSLPYCSEISSFNSVHPNKSENFSIHSNDFCKNVQNFFSHSSDSSLFFPKPDPKFLKNNQSSYISNQSEQFFNSNQANSVVNNNLVSYPLYYSSSALSHSLPFQNNYEITANPHIQDNYGFSPHCFVGSSYSQGTFYSQFPHNNFNSFNSPQQSFFPNYPPLLPLSYVNTNNYSSCPPSHSNDNNFSNQRLFDSLSRLENNKFLFIFLSIYIIFLFK